MEEKKEMQGNKGTKRLGRTNRQTRKIITESERVRKEGFVKEKADDEYRKTLHQDKIGMMKVKQGLVAEGPAEVEEQAEYTLWQKIEAYLICNKVMIIVASFFILLAAFLIYDLAHKDRPDVTLMLLNDDDSLQMCYQEIADIIDEYIDDMNGNGEIHSTVYPMPLSEDTDPYVLQASSTKLFAFMQDGDTILVIANEAVKDYLLPDQVLENLEELYPDNKYVKGYGFYPAGTEFAHDIGYEGEFPEDAYIGIRKVVRGARYRDKMQTNYDEAKKVMDALIERYT